jgi:hypothetical protein
MKNLYIMKKYIFILVVSISLIGCSSLKENEEFRYCTGHHIKFKFNDTNSTIISNIGFTPFFDSHDAQKFMYQNHGKWDNVIHVDNVGRIVPVLVWNDLNLFDWDNELYTVGIYGEDYKKDGDITHIFHCSAIVFNLENFDCLSENSPVKDSLFKYVKNGIKTINTIDKDFNRDFELIKQ